MTHWEKFLDSLDSPGGNIAVMLFLFLLGVGMVTWQVPKGEDVLIGIFGALVGYLTRSVQSNHARKNGTSLAP